ncbi:MAG: hypothetical protein CVV10_00105 [Gammaproteobacteria bacterium HGW-Gammaproteobacteria-14]|nr:MAG: hypothetical protein CVV10_00105 [Gammaproteobacteria bacterium HGW-Gammaproteobacteria-14]
MPLIVSEIPLSEASAETFSNVLKANPDLARAFAKAAESGDGRLFQGIFNAKPVALLRVISDPLIAGESAWRLSELVVHPATRKRGVGKEMVRQAGALLAPATLDSGPRW